MRSLFDELTSNRDWRPQPPPSLNGVSSLHLDTETTGLKWWRQDRPVGISVCLPGGYRQYLPFGHAGGNLDENQVREWCRRELRGKHISGANIRFDLHQLKSWGVDLEEQGCTFSDIQHQAALLDDSRRRFGLEILAQEELGEGKSGQELDKTRMRDYHAGDVAAYAERDVWLGYRIEERYLKRLNAENLMRVKHLEDDLIPVVVEMERNAAPIDMELLTRWERETEQEYLRCLWRVARAVGFQVSPGKAKDMTRAFEKLGIPLVYLDSGNPSFTDAILKSIDHPVIKDLYRAAKLEDLRSKYLVKYKKTIAEDGLLRYALHQLRGDEGGTITGRFSCSAIDGEGGNIQQVPAVEKHQATYGDEFQIRELFIPRSGFFLDADASQIEYRIFAHLANNPKIIAAYKEDPWLSFHKKMHEAMLKYKKDLLYKQAKNISFCKIYGGGMAKLALMLGYITDAEFAALQKQYPKGVPHAHPKLAKAVEVNRIYARELPEVDPMLRRYSEMAKTQGYVETMIGRRSRFPSGQRLHKGLNSAIQGTGADILKMKLIELHRERKDTGLVMRMTAHDSITGDCPNDESKQKVSEILNRQSLPMNVPILFEVKTGAHWAACDSKWRKAT